MSIRASLRSALTLDFTVSPIIAGRCYAKKLPKNTVKRPNQFPAIVMHLISAPGDHSQDGPTNLNAYRYQLNLYAHTLAEVEALAAAVKGLLDGYKGQLPSIGANQSTIDSCFYETSDDDEDEADGRELILIRQDYVITVSE